MESLKWYRMTCWLIASFTVCRMLDGSFSWENVAVSLLCLFNAVMELLLVLRKECGMIWK